MVGERFEFISNYNDLSTDRGFQFEFKCSRCQAGYRTQFKSSVTGTINEVLGAASSIFGGIFGTAANLGNRMHSAAWEKGHDDAFKEAIEEIKPSFIQCPRCSSWVCRKGCWNNKQGLCKECAPDLGVEMSAAQANKSVQEIWEKAAMAEEDKKLGAEYWRETIVATCPKCESPLAANAKFCPDCGEKLKKKDKCPSCGTAVASNAKFCTECGGKI